MKNYHVRYIAGNPEMVADGRLRGKIHTDGDGPHMRTQAIDIASNRLAVEWRVWVEHALTGERIFENDIEKEWRKRDGNREYEAPDRTCHPSPLTGGWAPVKHNPTDGVTVFGHEEFGEVRVSWLSRLYCIGPDAGALSWRKLEGYMMNSGRDWKTRLAQGACDACAAQWSETDSEDDSNRDNRPSA